MKKRRKGASSPWRDVEWEVGQDRLCNREHRPGGSACRRDSLVRRYGTQPGTASATELPIAAN